MASRRKLSKRPIKHIGFEAAAEKAAASYGGNIERGRAAVAVGARKASAGAKKANPRLLRVHGARPVK